MRKFLYLLLFLVGFGLGAYSAHSYYTRTSKPVESASVILEKIHAVCKLVTVEGQFSEILDYDAYVGDFPMFWDKKALVRVQAKVAAGYDLGQLNLSADESTRTLTVHNLPKAKILSVDHSLDYYNISEGLFSSFARTDHNLLQMRAKSLISEKAQHSELLPRAEEEGKKTLELIAFMVKGMGWTMIIEDGMDLNMDKAVDSLHVR